MKRWEFRLRLTAYACGLAGVVLALWTPSGSPARPAGFILLVAMFVLFVAAHTLRLAGQMRAIHRPLRPVDPWRGGRRDEARGEPPDPGAGPDRN